MRVWSVAWEDGLMKEGCPKLARRILPLVEDACDEMDYAGSRMYDEVPDRQMMRRLSERVCRRAAQMFLPAADEKASGRYEKNPADLYADDEIFATDDAVRTTGEEPDPCVCALVETLLCHEIFARRCARRMHQGGA